MLVQELYSNCPNEMQDLNPYENFTDLQYTGLKELTKIRNPPPLQVFVYKSQRTDQFQFGMRTFKLENSGETKFQLFGQKPSEAGTRFFSRQDILLFALFKPELCAFAFAKLLSRYLFFQSISTPPPSPLLPQ